MSEDERFDLSDDSPLMLKAHDAEDLTVLSTFLQDSLFLRRDFQYDSYRREISVLLNRVRWEQYHNPMASQENVERVRSLLRINDVLECRHNLHQDQGSEVPFSLLSLEFVPATDGMGKLNFRLSGHWDIHADIECVDIYLSDVTRPYSAPSKKYPKHPE